MEEKTALTNAQRQANFKAKKDETINKLMDANAVLQAENSKLHQELVSLREKMHQMEVRHLKEKLKKAV